MEDLQKRVAALEHGTEWPAERIRQTFVDFFVNHPSLPHVEYKSCPVVPLDDPTLLFINAGMNQFKPIFLGQVDPSHPMSKLTRAVNSQKCIRAGGKHNDLDDVGKDVYHHTFFEMLGNWSFGNYFKEGAIDLSWTLLTKVYGLEPERLYVTYFGGDAKQNLPADEETKKLWLKYVPESRLLPFGCKDNFWEMGDQGPCGPCTEIHYDRIGGRDASARVNADFPDVIEIWNNVFIQFNREPDGSLVVLPSQHVDTGMGFERLASILQGKMSNYDTDVFMPLFASIQSLCGATEPYTGKLGDEDPTLKDMAYRVVADHIRTLTFAISDGAVPSSDGRGYVLRRILRRAVRYGEQFLGAPRGFLSKLVPKVVEMMGAAFPELVTKQSQVIEVILDEEESFGRTLNKGLDRFKKIAAALKAEKKTVVPGEDAFFLYDSMGFPLDLTQLMAEEQGLVVDVAGYDLAMKIQKENSGKKAGVAGVRPLVLESAETAHLAAQHIAPTHDDAKYIQKHVSAKVVAIFTTTATASTFVQSTAAHEHAAIGVILDTTSFYAQSGGQIYDTGVIKNGMTHFNVHAAESYAGYVLHVGPLTKGTLHVGDEVQVEVDYQRRNKIAPNHTMTHVLNYALRHVLGTTVDQRGSLVDDARLRFDFTTNKPLKPDQIAAVEAICKDVIAQELPVYVESAPQAHAKRIQGLRAVFGETYPEHVRVVSIGAAIPSMLADPENAAWKQYSVEFCGGTHLTNTKEAVSFALFEEGAVAKGIRRMSAYTGEAAKEADARANGLKKQLDDLATLPVAEIVTSVAAFRPVLDTALISLPRKEALKQQLNDLIEKIKAWQKEEAAARAAAGVANVKALVAAAKASGEEFVVLSLDVGAEAKLGRELLDAAVEVYPDGSFFIFSVDADRTKTAGFAQVSAKHHAAKGLDAKNWVNGAMASLGGKGGGKDPLTATGQAKTVVGLEQAIAAAKAFVH
ncbi:alanine-tRNA ligase [Aphanomyces invadans]|uniref:Alanine--tRNA ligase n=1 Tax=Aphanomyces invadans TaxID=157072 RepID=A0A024UCS6_9STRA|nr:alanine-tRNA ligase [Aphanomyces invadans]ETW04010.1 alanine-tRNA ligase [Aphanomyces invadans]|eukprot:XP_008866966.1 alanine-tRNA ligase [Aphanomyces invadans]